MSSTSPHSPSDPLRPPTMADVAAAAGVSRALVSIVMRGVPGASDATRARVKATAERLGYRPHAAAQVLRRAQSGNLGVLFSPRYPFEVEIVEAVYPAATQHGFDVVLSAMSPDRDLDQAVEELLSYRCEALVIVGLDRDDEWFSHLLGRVPVVRIGRPDSAAGVDVVRTDEAAGVDMAIDHLVGLGHRRIAFLGGGNMPGAVQRAAAYEHGMLARGLGAERLVIDGDYTDESGAAAARAVLDAVPRPTAVIAANDWSAVGLLTTLERNGVRVPEQMSVVGFDNSELARRSYVSLTSVGQDPAALAAEAVAAAHRRRTPDGGPPSVCVLPPHLALRTSTAPPFSRT